MLLRAPAYCAPVCCTSCSGSGLLSSIHHLLEINSLRQDGISVSCQNTSQVEALQVSKCKRHLLPEPAQEESLTLLVERQTQPCEIALLVLVWENEPRG